MKSMLGCFNYNIIILINQNTENLSEDAKYSITVQCKVLNVKPLQHNKCKTNYLRHSALIYKILGHSNVKLCANIMQNMP